MFTKGKSGNPRGRPKVDLEARDWLRKLVANKGKKRIEAIVDDPAHPDHALMLRFCYEQAHGKATQRLEHASDPDSPVLVDIAGLAPEVLERIADMGHQIGALIAEGKAHSIPSQKEGPGEASQSETRE